MTGGSASYEFENLTDEQLKAVQQDIERAISARRRRQALSEIKRIAAEAGLDIAEVLPETEKRPTVDPVYVDPQDESRVWNGKGRHPKWFKLLVRSGVDPDSLLRKP